MQQIAANLNLRLPPRSIIVNYARHKGESTFNFFRDNYLEASVSVSEQCDQVSTCYFSVNLNIYKCGVRI